MSTPQTKRLEKLGLFTPKDILYYTPKSYEDRRRLPKIYQLKTGETQTLLGSITHLSETNPRPKISILKAVIKDDTGTCIAIWFNQAYLKKIMKIGTKILIKGKCDINAYSAEKEITVISTDFILSAEDTLKNINCIVPNYLLTQGLYPGQYRNLVQATLDKYLPSIVDPLPISLRQTYDLIPLRTALTHIHFPETEQDLTLARKRLVFDEFFFFQLTLASHYTNRKIQETSIPLTTKSPLIDHYKTQIPYTLTNAQQQAIKDVENDVSQPIAMNRLLQGDVGSGKTDVAVMALLFAINSQKKGVIMAPTEILAVQHYLKFKTYFDLHNIPVYLLKGGLKKKEKEALLNLIKQDDPCIIVGTHALIQATVEITHLGLAVIDEQHRFGVMQRLALKQKGLMPHCLFMTATPIPRTLLITSFGDLDKSIINEMPPGRTPPKTYFFKESSLASVYGYCRDELAKDYQIYIVYPLVEESEKLDLTSAIEGWTDLQKNIFPEHTIGLIHGRLTPQEKSDIMAKFKQKEIPILVATTVIEVGIDVPNATIMIIHHAERFGLSQLHQLRGRIGRGAGESRCFLIGDPKTTNAKQRVKAMLATANGFKIAEYDLEIRGPGDMLGTRQSGLPDFNLAHLIRDEAILIQARKAAIDLIESDPQLEHPHHQAIKHIQKEKQLRTLSIQQSTLN